MMSLAPEASAVGPVIPRTAAVITRRSRSHPQLVKENPSNFSQRPALLSSVLGGTTLAVAWLVPETVASALLGWAAALLLVYAVRSSRTLWPLFLGGFVGHLVAFHWIVGTVSVFGGFGLLPAAGIFTLFAALGALEFVVFGVVHRHLGKVCDALALRSAVAIAVAELVSIRLFRWHVGHTQIAFTPFVQVADLGGAILVSFLTFWVAEAVVRAVVFRERRPGLLLPIVAFGLALGYGRMMMHVYGAPAHNTQEVVLVQGNASLAEKRDLESARRNLVRLGALSRAAARPGALIVWPEGSIPAYIPATVGSVVNEPALPRIDGSAFLVGAYACDRERNRYNAAFAVRLDGKVPEPYFKRVLIPFGESMPLAGLFPGLARLNAKAGAFCAGTEAKVFAYPMQRADGTAYTLKVAPLICYEDTVPALAREATNGGAELLVNLTSDSWFGRSVALHQHHLIAAFRAIENRRYLVRATNTGLSGVVDPLGRTIARIAPYAEGTATVNVGIYRQRTAYTAWLGDAPWWALAAIVLGAIGHRRLRREPTYRVA